jgi:hypothetical protein
MRYLNQDARAVAGILLAATGTAMHEIPENRQRVRNDLVRAAALDVHDKTDTAGVVFVSRVIKTLLRLALQFQFQSPYSFTAGDVVRHDFSAPIKSKSFFARQRGLRPDQENSFFCP